MLNSFVSGTSLTHDYTKAIDDVIDMYLKTYSKIISMPMLPWLKVEDSSASDFRLLLQQKWLN